MAERRSIAPGRRARTALALSRDRRGVAAVEFALIAPIFVALLLGVIGFGQIISVHHGLAQLAAEAARASVGGMNDGERATLARQFVAENAGAYVGIDPARLQVSTTTAAQATTEVTLSYDLSDALLYRIAPTMALPDPTARRSAAIQRGGY